MIPYEGLCRALDIYNRKLRGEDVPEEAYQEEAFDDDFDIVESEDAGVEVADMDMEVDVDMEVEGQYGDAVPDVTAETAVPEADFGGHDQPGSGEYAEGQDQAPEQQPDAYPDDQDPNRQQ